MKTRDKSLLQVNLSMFGSWMLRSSLEAECCEIVKMIEWHWIYNYINCFITTCPIYIKYSMRCTWIVDEYRRASLSIQIIRITQSLRAHWCWPGVSATTRQSGYKRCATEKTKHILDLCKLHTKSFKIIQKSFATCTKVRKSMIKATWLNMTLGICHFFCFAGPTTLPIGLGPATIFPGIPGSHAFPIIHRPGANATTLQSQGTSWPALPKQENLVNYINHSK